MPNVGTNLQTLPPRMKPFIRFDKGYMGFNTDMSQAEYRIVANIAPEPRMLRALADGVDVHKNTYSLMFGTPLLAVSNEPGSSDLGDGSKSQRDWGKQCNHALNYGLGPLKFSDRYELPANESRDLIARYHKAFPGIQGNYHRRVEEMLKTTRSIRNPYGRLRQFLDRLNGNLYQQGYAFTPQSTVADHILRHGFLPLYYKPEYKYVELLMQVHDSVVYQIPLALGFERMAEILQHLKLSMETPIPESKWCGAFSIPADFQCGYSLGKKDKKKVHDPGMMMDLDMSKNVAAQLEKYWGENESEF